MPEQNWKHWRNFSDTNHLRAEMFMPGEEKVLTIREVKKEAVVNNNGVASEKPVVYFMEANEIPMVLNVSNCKIIEKLYGTGNVYDWVGKKIQIYPTTTKVGRESGVPCLRIRNFIPESNVPEYKCSVCGKSIDKDTYTKSVAKFGKAYCSPECYSTDVNGEQILK